MEAKELNRRIERAGGVMLRQRGSHRLYAIAFRGRRLVTVIPQHSGDLPKGTLAAIDRQLAPVLGKGWTR